MSATHPGQLPAGYARCPVCRIALGPRDSVRWCKLARCQNTNQHWPTAQDIKDFKIGQINE